MDSPRRRRGLRFAFAHLERWAIDRSLRPRDALAIIDARPCSHSIPVRHQFQTCGPIIILEKRILVAEDDRTTRDAWSELIVAWGYRVKTAENGEAALNEAAAYDPHILLLDLNLPRKNGLQVLQELKERGLRIPTIVISGQGEIPDVVKTIKLGAYDYLRKPVDPAHLR